ncbi:acyl-CoA dehydrogenase family protein [Tersicoccus sp. Bi-70]|uniref:acyl-CoA dehydrogenase family protein n=1 Tax=Tersicoccus sp. Bi-70 TaxID=1897634 RepID=UPI00267A8C28
MRPIATPVVPATASSSTASSSVEGSAPSDLLAGLLPLDALDVAGSLPADEQRRLAEATVWLQDHLRPASIAPWRDEAFPRDLVADLGERGYGNLGLQPGSRLFTGLLHAQIARADVSLSSFVGIHNELVVGMIDALGSAEQRARLIPGLSRFTTLGSFALTEPDHGSDIAGGLATTARRDGDEWIISGAKRWIGAGTVADIILTWARDEADGVIKAFIVETDRPGFAATKIEHKLGLRIMQNADLTFDAVRVPDANRLPGAHGFAAANRLLCDSRAWVGWQAVGAQLAAVDIARRYVLEREQFGRPLGAFQLVQASLVEMFGNVTLSLGLMTQIARTQEEGRLTMPQAALAKSTLTRLARETVSLGRNLLGGNGILVDHEMAKLLADVEVLHTYEGTFEINTLIVGRAATGLSAFV